MERLDRAARVQSQAQVARGVRRSSERGDDAGREQLGDRAEASEVRGDELDVGPARQQETLGRAVETAQVAHVRLREDVEEVDQQRAHDLEVLPVVAGPERVQEPRRLTRSERDHQAVAPPNRGDGLVHRDDRQCRPRSVRRLLNE